MVNITEKIKEIEAEMARTQSVCLKMIRELADCANSVKRIKPQVRVEAATCFTDTDSLNRRVPPWPTKRVSPMGLSLSALKCRRRSKGAKERVVGTTRYKHSVCSPVLRLKARDRHLSAIVKPWSIKSRMEAGTLLNVRCLLSLKLILSGICLCY